MSSAKTVCSVLLAFSALLATAQMATADDAATKKSRVKSLVEKAVAYYRDHGQEETFKEVNKRDGKLRDGELYVFVCSLDGTILANGQLSGTVGKNLIRAKDLDGRRYVKEGIELAKSQTEFWQEYKYLDPVSKQARPKTSFIKRVDNKFLFGSGFYH